MAPTLDIYEEALGEMGGELSEKEQRELSRANVFVMDWEADGGTFPPEIQTVVDKQPAPYTTKEARMLIEWFRQHAPGDY